MLRRKVEKPEDSAPGSEAAEDAASVEPDGILEEDVRDEEIAVTEAAPEAPAAPRAVELPEVIEVPDTPEEEAPAAPAPPVAAEEPEPDYPPVELPPPLPDPEPGPVAQHSPEPQTLAERLTAQQQSTPDTPTEAPDPKALMKERRAASKRQRVADRANRKAAKKAAKEARRARGKTDDGDETLDPDQPTAPDRPANPPAGSPAAGIAAAAAETEAVEQSRIEPPPGFPPVTPPGQKPPAARRTAALIGGIDLGGTKIAAAVLDADHKVVSYRRRPTPDKGGPADVVRAMALTIQEAAIDAGTEAHKLLAVGVGSPGSVNPATGDVSGAGNLPDWDGTFQLGRALREEIGTEVRVGNDVQVGTRGEFELGAGSEYSSLLGVFWGTGVGGGIIINGQPWLGRGRAGEIGHTLVRRGGAKGLNGLNGTVEAYAGRKAMEEKARREVKKGRKTKLFKLMRKHDKTHLTSAIWQHALDEKDELAEDLLNRAVGALSAGIASAVNLLDPEAVVIGGGLGVRFADTLVPEIIEGMKPYLLDQDDPPPVKIAALGDEGGVIGASLLVSDVLESNQAPSVT